MSNKEENFFSNDTFKLPIEYIDNKHLVSQYIKDDLEIEISRNTEKKAIYYNLFKPNTELGVLSIPAWGKYYTTNKDFLEDSQNIYKNIKHFPFDKQIINNMLTSWREIHNETNFMEKYQYIEWNRLKWLNKSSIFLTILSFYNISAPALQLIAPIFILIVPFFVLKIMKLPINWNTYYKILIENLKRHSIGKLFFSFKDAEMGQKIYILFAVGMYLWNIYQNIISCYRFYKNSYFITSEFETINTYLEYTIQKILLFENIIKKHKTYNLFKNKLIEHKEKLINFHTSIKNLPSNNENLGKIAYIGKLMKLFYILYDDEQIQNMFKYSFGFHGYIDTILGIQENIESKKINSCKYKKSITFKLKNMYHPNIDNPVKNNININKNIIITGPNAAGKTTTIKATVINLLLNQQIGYGFYDSCQLSLFDYIHCYLNIPDTCSRDSLFQAEARRCKNILDTITNNKNKKHFCIFDELYSGTNPYEAISSAHSYLNYISKYKNVRFLLTTHFIKLCELFKKNKNITNKSMETKIAKNNLPEYCYKIQKGISNIKGGVSVLKILNYPDKIINNTIDILETL